MYESSSINFQHDYDFNCKQIDFNNRNKKNDK